MALDRGTALRLLYDRFEKPTRQLAQFAHATFVRGDGNPSAPIVFVGEAPGLNEDQQGRPFVGRAGQILNGWLTELGLRREEVYITNVVKCHPMKNPATPAARSNDRPPTPAEIALCWPILREEIQIIRPKVIVTLGSPAMRTLLETKEKISLMRGRFHPLPGIPGARAFCIYHPAALCHNPTLKSVVTKDLSVLRQELAA